MRRCDAGHCWLVAVLAALLGASSQNISLADWEPMWYELQGPNEARRSANAHDWVSWWPEDAYTEHRLAAVNESRILPPSSVVVIEFANFSRLRKNDPVTTNHAPGGAALHIGSNSELTLRGTVFESNVALHSLGGAIYADSDCQLAVQGCLFARNDAFEGAGMWVSSRAVIDVDSTAFVENVCSQGFRDWPSGGAIKIAGGTQLRIYDSQFVHNYVPMWGGGYRRRRHLWQAGRHRRRRHHDR